MIRFLSYKIYVTRDAIMIPDALELWESLMYHWCWYCTISTSFFSGSPEVLRQFVVRHAPTDTFYIDVSFSCKYTVLLIAGLTVKWAFIIHYDKLTAQISQILRAVRFNKYYYKITELLKHLCLFFGEGFQDIFLEITFDDYHNYIIFNKIL